MRKTLRPDSYIEIVGPAGVRRSEPLWRDPPGALWHRPDLIVAPGSTADVARVVRQALSDGLPVIPAGGGTSYGAGIATPQGGILLSTQRLNVIEHLDTERQFVTVGAGITVQALNQALGGEGLWWPHDPGSRAMATVGGAVSVNGMGTYYARYGAAPESVLGLTVVTPTGEVVTTPIESRERAGALSARDLYLRTEGSYGTITEVTLKVWPLPEKRHIEVFGFESITACHEFARALLREPISPEAFFVESRIRFQDSLGDRAVLSTSDPFSWFVVIGLSGTDTLIKPICGHLSEIAHEHGGASITDRELITAYWERKTAISTLQRTTIPSYHIVDPSLPYLALQELNRHFVESTANLPEGIERKGERYYVSWPAGHTTLSGQIYYDENDAELVQAAANWVERFTHDVMRKGSPRSAILGSGKRFRQEERTEDSGLRAVTERVSEALAGSL